MKIKKYSQAYQGSRDNGILSNTVQISERGNERNRQLFHKEERSLYDVFKDHESYEFEKLKVTSLETRYVPGFPGVQAQRVPGTSTRINPITKKEYSFEEGFESGGITYRASSVSMQTKLYSLAEKLDNIGLKKYSNEIRKFIK